MIKVLHIGGNKYKVTEIRCSFTNTIVKDWFYDMDKLLLSEKSDFPDNILTRKLNNIQIDWFNIHYKPKVKK